MQNQNSKGLRFTPQVQEPAEAYATQTEITQWANPTGLVEMRNIRINPHWGARFFEMEIRHQREGKLTKWAKIHGSVSDAVCDAFTNVIGERIELEDGTITTDYTNKDILFNQIVKRTPWGDGEVPVVTPVNPRKSDVSECLIELPIDYSCVNYDPDERMNPFKVHIDDTGEETRIRLMMVWEQAMGVHELVGNDKIFYERRTALRMDEDQLKMNFYRFNYKVVNKVMIKNKITIR